MNEAVQTLTSLAKARIWALVQSRAGECADSPEVWVTYLNHAQRLPHWIRHNGLRLTLDYLRLLAQQREDAAAAALLADWAAPLGTEKGLHLAALLDPRNNGGNGVAWQILLTRRALQEADLFKRYAELSAYAGRTGPGGRHGAATGSNTWSVPAPIGIGPEHFQHPGVLWRFGGRIGTANLVSFRRDQVVATVAAAHRPGEHRHFYDAAFRRRAAWLKQRAIWAEAGLRTRLFTDLGDRGVFETQTALHPVTGMPIIPSSALKNALRRYLLAKIDNMPTASRQEAVREFVDRLLGSDRFEGTLVVHDAWWVPSASPPLVGDIDTPHHAAYDRSSSHSNTEASPTDSPEPNPQLATTGNFLIAVERLPVGDRWARHALRWLHEALGEGVGGRKRVGGGRFRPPGSAPASAQAGT